MAQSHMEHQKKKKECSTTWAHMFYLCKKYLLNYCCMLGQDLLLGTTQTKQKSVPSQATCYRLSRLPLLWTWIHPIRGKCPSLHMSHEVLQDLADLSCHPPSCHSSHTGFLCVPQTQSYPGPLHFLCLASSSHRYPLWIIPSLHLNLVSESLLSGSLNS